MSRLASPFASDSRNHVVRGYPRRLVTEEQAALFGTGHGSGTELGGDLAREDLDQLLVLEIGAGSGYMAALLAARGRSVTTVEIEPELAKLADENLAANGVSNAQVALGDGSLGWKEGEPYDVICVSGGRSFFISAIFDSIRC